MMFTGGTDVCIRPADRMLLKIIYYYTKISCDGKGITHYGSVLSLMYAWAQTEHNILHSTTEYYIFVPHLEMREKQRLIQSMIAYRSLIAPFTNAETVIGHNHISAARVFQKHFILGTVHGNDSEFTTKSFDVEYFYPNKQSREHQHRVASGNTTEPSVELIPITLQNDKRGRCKNFVAPLLSKASLFFDTRPDVLLVRCTTAAPFED